MHKELSMMTRHQIMFGSLLVAAFGLAWKVVWDVTGPHDTTIDIPVASSLCRIEVVDQTGAWMNVVVVGPAGEKYSTKNGEATVPCSWARNTGSLKDPSDFRLVLDVEFDWTRGVQRFAL
jgi:hypothetical protein